MLAEIAPSVAGCTASKPNRAEATRLTAITPAATLTPLRICWPTNSFRRAGERSQLRMGQGGLGEVEMLSPLRTATKFSPNFYLAETRDFNALEIEKVGNRVFC